MAASPEPAPSQPAPLRVLFCWTEVNGYVTACWRELAARPNVDVHVLHVRQLFPQIANPFGLDPLLGGVSHEMFDADRPDLDRWLLEAARAYRPDVIVVAGWLFRPYIKMIMAPELADVAVAIGMDSPWRGTIAQRLARLRLGGLIRRAAAVITAGERSAEYAERLGVDARRVRSGYYGYDDGPLAPVAQARASAAWPRQFLFVGRYVEQKDLATLASGYAKYRTLVANPWGLTCCGVGPEGRHLAGVPGLTDAGFVQPAGLPDVFRRHGTFVLASRFEPWGVVLAEAAASGLPVICTSTCGASVDLVRPYYNGLVTAPGDADGLARAMLWAHTHEPELRLMGERGRALAAPFAAAPWAARWHHYLLEAAGR